MNNDYNKERYKQIAIRISPEEAEEIKAKATETRLSIARLIVLSVRAYQPTGAEKTQAETHTETQAETAGRDQQGKPQDKPQELHSKPQDASKQGKTDITSKATKEPTEDAQRHTENAGEDQPEKIRIYTEAELRQAIQEAAQQAATQAARQARQEIKREMKAQAIQATAHTIGAARRAKAATVSTVNGLKPLRIRRGKK